jgi:mRNA-degrading endonuclease toxin of MazEF toxin-antitoxin module
VRPGEIWVVELDKRRPAVVMRAVPWLTEAHVVPITSTIRGLPSEIVIDGLPLASVANAQRLTLVPTSACVRRVGVVPPSVLAALSDAVCAVLGC